MLLHEQDFTFDRVSRQNAGYYVCSVVYKKLERFLTTTNVCVKGKNVKKYTECNLLTQI